MTEEPKYRDRDWLYEQYIVKDKNMQEIVEEAGKSYNVVNRWLKRHELKDKRKSKLKRRDGDYIECGGCGEEFYTQPSEERTYCSRECFFESGTKPPTATAETDIEQIGKEILEGLGVEYEAEAEIGGFFVDAFVPSQNICIEFDGDYWHGHPRFGELDETRRNNLRQELKKDACLSNRDLTVVRVWGSDIRENTEAVKHRLRQVFDGEREVSDTPGAGYLIEAFEEPTVQTTLAD